MNAVIELFRAATQRGARPSSVPEPAKPSFQGYVDERSTHHIAGWLRNTADPAERCGYEIVLPGAGGGRVLAAGCADTFSDVLVRVGVGDGRYAFSARFEPPLTEAERDRVEARPAGLARALELAPELKTAPPAAPVSPGAPVAAEEAPPIEAAPVPGPFLGYIDERSTEHVAGWLRDMGDPGRRVMFEIVLPGVAAGAERVLHRGRADTFSHVLRTVGVGDGFYAFYVLLSEPLTEAERDRLLVRPQGSGHTLQLAPSLRTAFEPISHIAMDIVNNCNIRCPFCVFDYANTKTTKFMSDDTFDAALRLLPYVTDGNFWLSCLHEATLHPRLIEFIERVPAEHRRKLFYTTNLAKRMPRTYFDFLANSGMHHLNISVESLDPAIYERMRKGARHRIFQENWDTLLGAFATGGAAPKLRYNMMAYRSNLHEIPAMIEVLRRDKQAWQVEIRHTYDEPHIPASFRDAEFLSTAEWAWLADRLKGYDPAEVLLLLPPGGAGYDTGLPAAPAPATPAPDAPVPAAPLAGAPALETPMPATEGAVEAAVQPEAAGEAAISQPGGQYDRIPRPLNISMDWDGTLRVYGEEPRGPGQPPTHVNYVMTNIGFLKDPLRFLLAL